ncbi:MAG: hypothetical protein ACFFD2_29565, partial [Promethearchaeota archaeon]
EQAKIQLELIDEKKAKRFNKFLSTYRNYFPIKDFFIYTPLMGIDIIDYCEIPQIIDMADYFNIILDVPSTIIISQDPIRYKLKIRVHPKYFTQFSNDQYYLKFPNDFDPQEIEFYLEDGFEDTFEFSLPEIEAPVVETYQIDLTNTKGHTIISTEFTVNFTF